MSKKKKKPNSGDPRPRPRRQGPTVRSANEHRERLLEFEGTTMQTTVERTMRAQAEDGLDGTFSREAMNDLTNEMVAFVLTRIERHYAATGLMPQTMTVTLNVDVAA